MKYQILVIAICICVNAAAPNEFSSILNSKVECADTTSIVMQNNNQTWKVTECVEPLPLNAAVDSKQITQFTLEYNEMKWLTQEQFQGLSSVEHLRLFENNVHQMDENTLGGLKYLTNLTIIEPHLAIEELQLSTECTLQHLKLRLHIFDRELLSKLPKDLMNITIEDTPVINGAILIPRHLVNIKYLRLKNCSVTTFIGPNVALSALEYLDLSHNNINEKSWTWPKYPNLMTLILSHNRITDIGEYDLKNLKSLRRLQLDNNEIVNISFNAFQSNLNLTIVELSHNNLNRIYFNYTELHKFRVQAAFNPISCDSLQISPSYFNTDHIDCIEDHQKVPTESNNWVLVIIIIIIIILSICIVFYIYEHCSKRKGLPKTSNEVKECEATNENQSLIEVKPHLLFCGSEDGDSGQAISNLIQDAKPASTSTGPITSNEATNTRVSDDGNSGQANSKLKHHVKPTLIAHRLIIPKNEKKNIDSEVSSNLKRDAQPASTPTRPINSEDGDSGQANSILKLNIRTVPISTRQSYPRKAKIDIDTEERGSVESGSEDSDTGHSAGLRWWQHGRLPVAQSCQGRQIIKKTNMEKLYNWKQYEN